MIYVFERLKLTVLLLKNFTLTDMDLHESWRKNWRQKALIGVHKKLYQKIILVFLRIRLLHHLLPV